MERLQIVGDASKTVTQTVTLGPAAGVLWTRFLLARFLTLIRIVLLSFGSPACRK